MMGVKSLAESYGTLRMCWLRTAPLARMPIVYPSGFSVLRSAAPRAAPPPGLFTPTMGWPRILDAARVNGRAQTSVVPPAGYPMIKLMGLVGYLLSAAAV